MTKYSEIIKQMTLEQKAHLLTASGGWNKIVAGNSSISGMAFSSVLGGLAIRAGHKNAGAPVTCFPSASTLSRGWDLELAANVANVIGNEAKALGINVLSIPKAATLEQSAEDGISEDSYLCGKMISAYIRGIQNNNVMAALEYGHADMPVDEKALREKALMPYEMAVKEGRPSMLSLSCAEFGGEHISKGRHLFEGVLRTEWQYNGIVTALDDGTMDVAHAILGGVHMVLSKNPADAAQKIVKAVAKHRKLDSDVKAGNLTADKLNAAVAAGEALPESVVDTMLNQLLAAADGAELSAVTDGSYSTYPVNHMVVFDESAHSQMARRAACESAVLLKNDGILPFSDQARVAFIGEYVFKELIGRDDGIVAMENDITAKTLRVAGFETVGCAKGYSSSVGSDTSAALIGQAVELGLQADVAVVYVGAFGERLSELPVDQIALLSSLRSHGITTVAVCLGKMPLDMSWNDMCDAVLLAGDLGQGAVKAILKILSGAVNPSGKLTETVTDVPVSGGYRFCQKSGTEERYPFGFGLSYTSFEYSELKVNDKGVSFKIMNTGGVAGAEVAQLYIGKEDSAVNDSPRELKGFRKVYLEAGESKTVTIPFDSKSFRYYNTDTRSWETEGGIYQIYVAASSRDIRLFEDIGVRSSGAAVPTAAEKPEEPTEMPSEAVIENENFKPIFKAVIGGTLMLLLVIVTLIYSFVLRDGLMRDVSLKLGTVARTVIDIAIFSACGAGALGIGAWIIITIAKMPTKDAPALKTAGAVHVAFDTYKADAVYPYDWEEIVFDGVEKTQMAERRKAEAVGVKEEIADEETLDGVANESVIPVERVAKFGKNIHRASQTLELGLDGFYKNFVLYTAARGVKVDGGELLQLLSAMAACRVIALRGCDAKASVEVMRSLAECSDAALTVLNASEKTGISDLNYELISAVSAASRDTDKMNIILITGVSCDDLGEFMGSFVTYSGNAASKRTLEVDGVGAVSIPANLWFAVSLGDMADMESAALVTLTANADGAEDTHTALADKDDACVLDVYPLSCFVFAELISKARETNYLSEKYWRKIDRLEDWLAARVGFSLSNKTINAMEKYIALMMACGMEQTDAMDCVMSSLVLSSVGSSLAEALSAGDESLGEFMDSVFWCRQG